MSRDELLQALRRLAPKTGSLACLGCGHEHKCSTHGCAVIRVAADLIERLPEDYKIDGKEGKHHDRSRGTPA